MTTVETQNGTRKIDIKNKTIAMADGSMVPYIKVGIMPIDGVTYMAYYVNAKAGVPVCLDSHRKLHEISDAQKESNLRDQAVANVMSEGHGDY